MIEGTEVSYRQWEAGIETASMPLLRLCRAIFPDFNDDYLMSRLPRMADPILWLAEAKDQWIGFKLGYRRGGHLFYSWLGGVDVAARGMGVASELMTHQHGAAAESGYKVVETRTRAMNNGMISLNLRHGFQVSGFEIDASGVPIVILRKDLAWRATR